MSSPFEPDPTRDLILDATTLKALTHPLRTRMLAALRQHGPSTASVLAERLGVNSGATSYHLRQLAEAGLVVEDAERGNARDRWWRAAHQRTYFTTSDVGDDDASLAYLSAVGAMYADTAQRALDELPTAPEEWREATMLSNYNLQLTAEESSAMRVELETVLHRYRLRDADTAAPKGSRPVTVQLQVMLTPGMGEEQP